MKIGFPVGRSHLITAPILLALLIALTDPPAAMAHARVVRSNPEPNAELQESPSRIELWFNELLDDGFHAIEVFASREIKSPQRTDMADGKATVDPDDRTHLTVKIHELSPGEYVVQWRVLSRDGHSAPGRLIFRVIEDK